MSEAIITALITGGLALIGTWLSNRKSAALIAYRMEQLEKKVEKHNSVIERTYQLEKDVARLEDEDKRLNERLKIVEGKTA